VLDGDRDLDPAELERYYVANKFELWKGATARSIAETLLALEGPAAAAVQTWIEKAIDTDRRSGALWSLGRDLMLRAELRRQRDDTARAAEDLVRAAEVFHQCGATGLLEKVEQARLR
jgi:hypothetical protein